MFKFLDFITIERFNYIDQITLVIGVAYLLNSYYIVGITIIIVGTGISVVLHRLYIKLVMKRYK